MNPDDAFESVARDALGVAGVTRRMMFGRDTLLADGHPFAFRQGDRVALKLPSAAEVVASGEGTLPRMGKRVMRQWVAVPLVVSPELTERVDAARRFVDR
jgi:hypothetical protein